MAIPTHHKAAVLKSFNQPYVFEQIQTHRPGDLQAHDILIKVLAASYCHTDAVFASGQLSQSLPRVGCHEFAGEVVALGPKVDAEATGMSVGTRVGVPGRAFRPCGICYECTHTEQDPHGYSTFCPRAGNLGLTIDGGFQEYAVIDSRQAAPLPSGVEPTQAAPLMCAGVTIWSALLHERVRAARKIAILGAGGGLGHLGIQFAANLGMQVLAIDASDSGLSLAQETKEALPNPVGDRVVVADGRKSSVDELKRLIGEEDQERPASELGVEVVIMLPESQRAFDLGMQLLRNHGAMIVVSFPPEKLQVSAHDLVFRDISVLGTLVGRNHRLREMLKFVVNHKIRAKVSTCNLDSLNDEIDRRHQGHGGPGKLVVQFET